MPSFIIGGDFTWSGNTTFSGTVKSPALANSITANSVYFDTGTGLFTYGPAAGGVAFDPSFSYTITAALWTINGAFQFNAGFDVNSPNEISVISTGIGNPVTLQASNDNLNLNSDGNAILQSFSNNVFIQALASGQQVQIYADGFNFSCQNGDANFNSVSGNVNVNATNASLNLGGGNIDINATNNLNMFTIGAGNANFNTANGSLSIYSTTGDLNITAGNSGTSGNLNFNSNIGNCGFNVQLDINITSNTGSVNLNSSASNISAGPTGIGLGAGGSGMNVDATTGNFSFGASTGDFLVGAETGTVNIEAGTALNLDAFAATSGIINIAMTTSLAVNIGRPATTTTIDGTLFKIPNLGVLAGTVAAPSRIQPSGFGTVLIEIATNRLFYYVQS